METRSKRKRVAVKVDNDFTELDSDEFEQMLEEDSAPSRKKSNSKTTTAGTKTAKTSARAAAAAAAAAAAIDSDYEPEQDGSGPPAAAAAAPEPSTAQDSESECHSISDIDDAEPNEASDDEDYGSSKQQKTKKQQPKQKKPRKKRQSTRRLCLTYAKAQFKLTDKDLLELTDIEYRDNPHYACKWCWGRQGYGWASTRMHKQCVRTPATVPQRRVGTQDVCLTVTQKYPACARSRVHAAVLQSSAISQSTQ